jgi:hypothetical protein
MKSLQLLAGFISTLLLVSCNTVAPSKADASSGHAHNGMGKQPMDSSGSKVLFEDPMTDNWREHWFLDGKKATVEHRDGGLYFAAGTVTKAMDPVEYNAHHAVLWTKQEFEGDIRISFEMKRVDTSDYGAVLIYIQAQGIGTPPYVKDIYAWRKLREVPSMDEYFNYMNLLSISLRENIRCKRYPWNDVEKHIAFDPLIPPMYDWHGLTPGKWFRFEIDKRLRSLTFTMYDADSGKCLTECTWDTSKNTEGRLPRFVTKGRIGLRQMSTRQSIYKNFKVVQL